MLRPSCCCRAGCLRQQVLRAPHLLHPDPACRPPTSTPLLVIPLLCILLCCAVPLLLAPAVLTVLASSCSLSSPQQWTQATDTPPKQTQTATCSPPACACVEEGHQLIGLHVQQLVQVHATERELAVGGKRKHTACRQQQKAGQGRGRDNRNTGSSDQLPTPTGRLGACLVLVARPLLQDASHGIVGSLDAACEDVLRAGRAVGLQQQQLHQVSVLWQHARAAPWATVWPLDRIFNAPKRWQPRATPPAGPPPHPSAHPPESPLLCSVVSHSACFFCRKRHTEGRKGPDQRPARDLRPSHDGPRRFRHRSYRVCVQTR